MVRGLGRGRIGEALKFRQDGRGPNQAVARCRRGVGLKPAANGEDGPLPLGRDVRHDMACPREIVQSLGTELEVPTPPFVEPDIGTVQCQANVLNGTAGEAESNGTLSCREFVVHGNLRVAAASGCTRR
jgi:hypothetical protein